MNPNIFRVSAIMICFGICSINIYGQEAESSGSEQKRTTIMGLGDSITEGGDYFQCYLYPLWQKLITAGYHVEFIGPRDSRCRTGTLSHSGFSGKNAEFLDAAIDTIYRKYTADIVLLHAGHNHMDTEKPVPGMIAAYRSIIRKIMTINPDVKIFMAQVITSGKLPKYSYIPELNDSIAQMVGKMNCSNVILVNQAQGFEWPQHTVNDRVHPNSAGADKMADVWFKALQKNMSW